MKLLEGLPFALINFLVFAQSFNFDDLALVSAHKIFQIQNSIISYCLPFFNEFLGRQLKLELLPLG